MLVIGLITSFLLGLFANKFAKDSIWYENILNKNFTPDYLVEDYGLNGVTKSKKAYFRLSAGFLLASILLFVNLPQAQAVIFGAALILCVAEKLKIRFGVLFFTFIGITLFNLYPPHGKILFKLGGFAITVEALLSGIQKAVILEGMVYISKWMLKDKIAFSGFIGKSLSASISVFQKLMTVKHEIKPHKLIPALDSVLLSFDKLKHPSA